MDDNRIPTKHPDLFLRMASPSPEDCALVVHYIQLLGKHQGNPETMTLTPETTLGLLNNNLCEIVIVYYQNTPIGLACLSRITNVCAGITGFYLEGFYLDEAYRRKGFGRIVMAFLAKLTIAKGHQRLQWILWDWNRQGKTFYHQMGYDPIPSLETYRLEGTPLLALSKSFPGPIY